jgi:hypothetical protein
LSRQLVAGRIGLGTNPPPQFGQTFASTRSTQSAQKVHSKEQILASVDSGGKPLLQFSQVGLSSSIKTSLGQHLPSAPLARDQRLANGSATMFAISPRRMVGFCRHWPLYFAVFLLFFASAKRSVFFRRRARF